MFDTRVIDTRAEYFFLRLSTNAVNPLSKVVKSVFHPNYYLILTSPPSFISPNLIVHFLRHLLEVYAVWNIIRRINIRRIHNIV